MYSTEMPVTTIGLVQKIGACLRAAKAHAYDAMEAAAGARHLGNAEQKIEAQRLEDNALEIVRHLEDSLETVLILSAKEDAELREQEARGRELMPKREVALSNALATPTKGNFSP